MILTKTIKNISFQSRFLNSIRQFFGRHSSIRQQSIAEKH